MSVNAVVVFIQVFLQEGAIVDPVQPLEIQQDERLTQIEDIGAEQETILGENQVSKGLKCVLI